MVSVMLVLVVVWSIGGGMAAPTVAGGRVMASGRNDAGGGMFLGSSVGASVTGCVVVVVVVCVVWTRVA